MKTHHILRFLSVCGVLGGCLLTACGEIEMRLEYPDSALITPTNDAPARHQATLTPSPAAETTTESTITPKLKALVNLNVRSGPGLNYPVVDVLEAGDSALITGKSPDLAWWEIRCPAGMENNCWVSSAANYSQAFNVTPVKSVAVPPTVTALPRPYITAFTFSPETVAPGESITLAWQTNAGAQVSLASYYFSGARVAELETNDDNEISISIGEDERYWRRFVLTVANKSGETISQTLKVMITCPHGYFFDPARTQTNCPAGPAQDTLIADQFFEGGRMLWIEARDEVAVLYDDTTQSALYFPDDWEEGMPEPNLDVSPPQGRQAPTRGFGKIWAENPALRAQLGWALDTEVGYASVYQSSWNPNFDAGHGSWYVRTADERTLCLDANGSWAWETP